MKKIIFFLIIFAASSVKASEVPAAWLDSLEANLPLMELDDKFSSFRMRNIVNMLDKHDQVEERDTTWMKVTIEDNGNRLVYETDFMGIPKDDKPIDNEEDDESDMGPFDVIKKEYRDDYYFEIAESDDSDVVTISFDANKKLKEGFKGSLKIDRTNWRFISAEIVPVKFPGMVKEMNIKIDLDNSSENYSVIKRIETKVFAKVLLIKYRTVIIQELFDFIEK